MARVVGIKPSEGIRTSSPATTPTAKAIRHDRTGNIPSCPFPWQLDDHDTRQRLADVVRACEGGEL